MSEALSIYCRSCKKHLWVGQAGISGDTFYSGEQQIMKELKKFLFTHMDYWPGQTRNHDLGFGANQCLEDEGYEEIYAE